MFISIFGYRHTRKEKRFIDAFNPCMQMFPDIPSIPSDDRDDILIPLLSGVFLFYF